MLGLAISLIMGIAIGFFRRVVFNLVVMDSLHASSGPEFA